MVSFAVIILAVLLSLLATIFWLGAINYFTGFLSWKNFNFFNLIFGGIAAVGIAGILEFTLLEERFIFNMGFLGNNVFLVNSLVFSVFFASLLEEFVKGIVIFWGISKKTNKKKISVGMIIGIIVGLSFAVAENGIYFGTQIDSSGMKNIVSIIISRTIFSSAGHMIFSGLSGFFMAKFFFCEKRFLKFTYFFLALIIPVLIHFLFNISTFNKNFYWIPMVLLFFGIAGFFLVFKKNNETFDEQN